MIVSAGSRFKLHIAYVCFQVMPAALLICGTLWVLGPSVDSGVNFLTWYLYA